jgi:hypothetical protein
MRACMKGRRTNAVSHDEFAVVTNSQVLQFRRRICHIQGSTSILQGEIHPFNQVVLVEIEAAGKRHVSFPRQKRIVSRNRATCALKIKTGLQWRCVPLDGACVYVQGLSLSFSIYLCECVVLTATTFLFATMY